MPTPHSPRRHHLPHRRLALLVGLALVAAVPSGYASATPAESRPTPTAVTSSAPAASGSTSTSGSTSGSGSGSGSIRPPRPAPIKKLPPRPKPPGASDALYRAGVFVETMHRVDGCLTIQVGSQPQKAGTVCQPASTAAYLVLDARTMQQVGTGVTLLPRDGGLDAVLTNALQKYVSGQYVALVSAPAGCCSTSKLLTGGSSYVWNLDKGAADLATIGTRAGADLHGARNVGRTIPSSSLRGDLSGYLQPVIGSSNLWGFLASDYVTAQTEAASSTLVASQGKGDLGGRSAVVALTSQSGLGLEIPGANPQSGQALDAVVATRRTAEQWRTVPSSSTNGAFQLVNVATELCAAAATPTSVTAATCGAGPEQLWRPRYIGPGYVLAPASGPASWALSLNTTTPGSYLGLAPYTGAAGQLWTAGAIYGSPDPLSVNVLVQVRTGSALDILDASTDDQTAATVTAESDLPSQRWTVRPVTAKPGYVHLVNVNSGLCADVFGGNLSGYLIQYPCDFTSSDQPNQLWRPVLRSDGAYALTSGIDGSSVLTASSAAGGQLTLTADRGASSQGWRFKPMTGQPVAGSVGVLTSSTGSALDLADGAAWTPDDPSPAVAADDERDLTSQQWSVLPSGRDGQVRLRNGLSLRCLSAEANSAISTRSCTTADGDAAQLWSLTGPGDGVSVVNVGTGRALSLGSPTRRRPPQQPAAQTQTPWRDSHKVDVTHDFTGREVFTCAEGVPTGQTNLYPYLVPTTTGYDWNNISTSGVSAFANDFSKYTSQSQGSLDIRYTYPYSGQADLQISLHCTNELLNTAIVTAGLSVDAGKVTSRSTDATVTGTMVNGPRGTDALNHNTLALRVDYGTSYATYTQHVDGTSASSVTNNDKRDASARLTGLTPNTTYHYRLAVVRDGGDTSYTDDLTFTTAALGAPLVQADRSSAAAQRWTFRPLQHSVTMRVGTQNATAALPVAGSGSIVASVSTDGGMGPIRSFTHPVDDAAAAAAVTAATQVAGGTVLAQTAGQPAARNTSAWSALAGALAGAGGTAAVVNSLDGTGDYALVGCSGCRKVPDGTAAEVNSAVTRTLSSAAGNDHLTAQLGLDDSTDLRPTTAAPGDTLSSALIPLAYQRPTPWPIPAGVSASANTAVLAAIAGAPSVRLDGNSCYKAAVPDVRSDYCSTTLNTSDAISAISALSDAATADYTTPQFDAVRTQVIGELRSVGVVRSYVNQAAGIFTNGTTSTVQADVQAIAGAILTGHTSTDRSSTGVGGTAATMLAVTSFFFPEVPAVAGVLGVASAGIGWGSSLSDEDGMPSDDPFPVVTSTYVADYVHRLDGAAASIRQAGNLLVSDPVKLQAAATWTQTNADPTVPDWHTQSDDFDNARAALVRAARQQTYAALMPAVYSARALPVSDQPYTIWSCQVSIPQPSDYYPLTREPDSAVYHAPLLTGSGTGAPPRQWVALTTDQLVETGRYEWQLPTATLTDPLFAKPTRDLTGPDQGLFKPWFFANWTATTWPGGNQCGFVPPRAGAPGSHASAPASAPSRPIAQPTAPTSARSLPGPSTRTRPGATR